MYGWVMLGPYELNGLIITTENPCELMIDNFCKELTHPNSSKFNFENDLLSQAKVMEAARKSSLRKKLIRLANIK